MPLKNNLNILYEDGQLIVCIKPAGIASQGGKGFQQDLTDLLKFHIQKTTGCKGEPYLGIVHRLDQPVGGIMVYAKEPKSAASLSAQAASDEMKKRYYAVLEKKPAEQEGTLRDYLLRNGRTNMSAVVSESRKKEKDVKLAELSYRIIEEATDRTQMEPMPMMPAGQVEQKQTGQVEQMPAGQIEQMRQTEQISAEQASQQEPRSLYLAEIELKTGRHHQIRVQFAHAGCPLYGDRKYNPNTTGRELALFSHYLEFTHPKTKKRMQFEQKPDGGIFADFFA